jgi:hypothetical protein
VRKYYVFTSPPVPRPLGSFIQRMISKCFALVFIENETTLWVESVIERSSETLVFVVSTNPRIVFQAGALNPEFVGSLWQMSPSSIGVERAVLWEQECLSRNSFLHASPRQLNSFRMAPIPEKGIFNPVITTKPEIYVTLTSTRDFAVWELLH